MVLLRLILFILAALFVGALLVAIPILNFILIPLGAFWMVYRVQKQEKEVQ